MTISFNSWICEFNPPSLESWTYAVSVHGVCCFGSLPIGILLFYTTKWNYQHRRVIGVTVAILAALIVAVTHSFVKSFAPNDKIQWVGPFLTSTFGFSTFFKSINAGVNQYPEGADANLTKWLLWYVMLPEPEFAKGKMCLASTSFVLSKVKFLMYKVAGKFVLLTILSAIDLADKYDNQQKTFEWLISMHINGFIHIWILYLFASFCLDFSSLFGIVASGGMRMEPGFQNPLLESRCFKEAWGIRWDLPVQVLLKRTVYIPARQRGFGRSASAILTFFVSGLLHEYNFSIHNRLAYEPFKAMIFFVLMGMLMVIEQYAWDIFVPLKVQQAAHCLPSAVISTALTLLVSGLFEHFFIKSWVESGWIETSQEIQPYLSCTKNRH